MVRTKNTFIANRSTIPASNRPRLADYTNRGVLHRRNRTCNICGDRQDLGPLISCTKCLCVQHLSCIGLEPEDAKIIVEFFCSECEAKYGLKLVFAYNEFADGPQPSSSNTSSVTNLLNIAPTIDSQASSTEITAMLDDLIRSSSLVPTSGDTTEVETEPAPTAQRTTESAGNAVLATIEERTATPPAQRTTATPPIVLRISRGSNNVRAATPGPSRQVESQEESSSSDESSDEGELSEGDGRHLVVKAVRDMRKKNGKYEYRIVWADGSMSWEPESNCRGCVRMVNQFREEKGKTPSKKLPEPRKRFGATANANVNEGNWITIDQVLAAIEHYDRVKDRNPPASVFTSIQKTNNIQILGLDTHLYVLYTSVKDKQIYIADGENSYLKDSKVRTLVKNKIGYKPVGIQFVGQIAVDHCGSSAVLIALEFRRIHRLGETPTLLKAERTVSARLSKLHPLASKTLPAKTPFRNLINDTCPKCGKQYDSRNRRAFNMHKIACKG